MSSQCLRNDYKENKIMSVENIGRWAKRMNKKL